MTSGHYISLELGIGVNQGSAEEDYPESIVYEHTSGDTQPTRMYFESGWSARFREDTVQLRTKIEGVGYISFTMPHNGLWEHVEGTM
jgi:hypothetical protein